MRCEIVAIGTELLLGQIVDSNSSWIGEQLALAGIDSHFQVKVGDNLDRIVFCIRQALERSDAVICCGGLGPTQDDITREAIARVMGVGLQRDDAIVAKIKAYFEGRGRPMAENNKRQADVPIGASLIPQMPGTAPGLIAPVGDKVIYATPGVPREMHEMMLGTILPDLQRRAGQASVIRSRVIRTWGNSESGLAEVLADRMIELDAIGNPTLAFQASGIEGIKVRITAKTADEATARKILDAEEARIRALLGDIVFGLDEESMETVVLRKLRARGLTLAAAEAITGGVLASRMSDLDRDMTTFCGALITLRFDDPHAYGNTGAGRAKKSARRAREEFGADIGIAVNLAQDGEGERPNTAFLHIATGDHDYGMSTTLPGDRYRLRTFGVIELLNFLRKTLDAR